MLNSIFQSAAKMGRHSRIHRHLVFWCWSSPTPPNHPLVSAKALPTFSLSLRPGRLGATRRPAEVKWEVPKIKGTFLGVPIIRTIMCWGLYWGPLFRETTKWVWHLATRRQPQGESRMSKVWESTQLKRQEPSFGQSSVERASCKQKQILMSVEPA